MRCVVWLSAGVPERPPQCSLAGTKGGPKSADREKQVEFRFLDKLTCQIDVLMSCDRNRGELDEYAADFRRMHRDRSDEADTRWTCANRGMHGQADGGRTGGHLWAGLA